MMDSAQHNPKDTMPCTRINIEDNDVDNVHNNIEVIIRDDEIIQPGCLKKLALTGLVIFAFTIKIMHLVFTFRGEDPPYWIQSLDHISGIAGGLMALIGIPSADP